MKISTIVYCVGIIMFVYAIATVATNPTVVNQQLCVARVCLAGILLVLAVKLDKKRL